jgi:hypothetical protein
VLTASANVSSGAYIFDISFLAGAFLVIVNPRSCYTPAPKSHLSAKLRRLRFLSATGTQNGSVKLPASAMLRVMQGLDISFQTAFSALAAVAAVVWTGGLIVLQLRERPSTPSSPPVDDAYKQEKTTIQAGMACAAFGFLVPLVLLLLPAYCCI